MKCRRIVGRLLSGKKSGRTNFASIYKIEERKNGPRSEILQNKVNKLYSREKANLCKER